MHVRSPARAGRVWIGLALAGLMAWATGCATTGGGRSTLVPTRYQNAVGPYTIYTNFPLRSDSAPIQHLKALESQIQEKLSLHRDPNAEPIEVYILDSKASFSHFLKVYYPELPPRRAFFFAQGERRVVYTFQGGKLDEDLRHEATHALLNTSVRSVPLWLDEGLAEYFEVPRAQQGLNPEHISLLEQDLSGGWTPDLARLERIQDLRQMTPRDYREAWAWVHFLLNGAPAQRSILLAYLHDLEQTEEPSTLASRLESLGDDPNRLMRGHLSTFVSGAAPLARAESRRPTPTVTRLQSEDPGGGQRLGRAPLPMPARPGPASQFLASLRRLRWWR